MCVFLFPIIWQFSQNSLFQKKGAKIGFSIFCVLSLNFESYLFLGLLKHYKHRGFSYFFVFCFCKTRKGNGQVVKKGKFWTPTQKRKNWLRIEKLFFWYFCVFCVFCVFVFFPLFFFFSVFVFVFLFGGFKGQVRWPEGPFHLTLNPPYFCFGVFLFCFFVPFFASIKSIVFHWKRVFFVYFWVSPFVSP